MALLELPDLKKLNGDLLTGGGADSLGVGAAVEMLWEDEFREAEGFVLAMVVWLETEPREKRFTSEETEEDMVSANGAEVEVDELGAASFAGGRSSIRETSSRESVSEEMVVVLSDFVMLAVSFATTLSPLTLFSRPKLKLLMLAPWLLLDLVRSLAPVCGLWLRLAVSSSASAKSSSVLSCFPYEYLFAILCVFPHLARTALKLLEFEKEEPRTFASE